MKIKLNTIERNDTEMIATIEAMGNWEEERWLYNLHESFDIWSFNGKYYKIYKDSEYYKESEAI